MATGVLVVGVGSATKYIEKFITGRKAYDAVGLFGFETDTEDAEGVQVGDATSFDHVTEEALKKILVEKFTGEISQIPPAYSAIKQNGKKSYELARKGIEVSASTGVPLKGHASSCAALSSHLARAGGNEAARADDLQH